MMLKIVSLFLIGMLVLAMFGRLRVPGLGKAKLARPRKCKVCGAPRIGRGDCPCGGSSGGKGGRGDA